LKSKIPAVSIAVGPAIDPLVLSRFIVPCDLSFLMAFSWNSFYKEGFKLILSRVSFRR
jgi:hypothetical protein